MGITIRGGFVIHTLSYSDVEQCNFSYAKVIRQGHVCMMLIQFLCIKAVFNLQYLYLYNSSLEMTYINYYGIILTDEASLVIYVIPGFPLLAIYKIPHIFKVKIANFPGQCFNFNAISVQLAFTSNTFLIQDCTIFLFVLQQMLGFLQTWTKQYSNSCFSMFIYSH